MRKSVDNQVNSGYNLNRLFNKIKILLNWGE